MATKPNVLEPDAPASSPNTGASATGAVTPSDTTVFPYATRYLWVGGTGSLVLTMGGATVTLLAVPVGLWKFSCTQVRAATTATNIVALN
jgi:hypothetical protein